MNRIESVDAFRFLAVVAVIMLHTTPFNPDVGSGHQLAKKIYIGLDLTLTFAVPFFFIIAGYFWGTKVRSGENPVNISINMAKRIFTVLAAWSFIYLLPYNVGALYEHGAWGPILFASHNISNLLNKPILFLVEGTKEHLWFLYALIFALPICTFFVKVGKSFILILLSVILFILAVFAYAYIDTPLGIELNFNTRNGPFVSTLFFTIGYILSARQPKDIWLYYGAALYIAGVVLEFTEVYVLGKYFVIRKIPEFLFGTSLMGIGVALIALSNHRLVRIKWMSKLGKYTLGIYACHYMFVDIFKPIDKITDHLLWELGSIAIVYLLAFTVTYTLSKRPLLKKIVM